MRQQQQLQQQVLLVVRGRRPLSSASSTASSAPKPKPKPGPASTAAAGTAVSQLTGGLGWAIAARWDVNRCIHVKKDRTRPTRIDRLTNSRGRMGGLPRRRRGCCSSARW